MTPAAFMFSPEWRSLTGNQLSSWFPYAQDETWWEKHKHYKIRKVAIKMGIKIDKYLTALQGKVKTWQSVNTETCSGPIIDEDSKPLDCFTEKYNVYYDKYPAYRGHIPNTGGYEQNPARLCVANSNDLHDTCACQPPPMRDCGDSATVMDKFACIKTHFQKKIKPYFMCLMRRRLEQVQKIFIWKTHLQFQRGQKVNVHNRVVGLLRKEMGEKYCTEFCKVFKWDTFIHGDTAKEENWRTKNCMKACTLPFARCHTIKKCLKDSYFNNTIYQQSNCNAELSTNGRCGPNFGDKYCLPGRWCSRYSWCGPGYPSRDEGGHLWEDGHTYNAYSYKFYPCKDINMPLYVDKAQVV